MTTLCVHCGCEEDRHLWHGIQADAGFFGACPEGLTMGVRQGWHPVHRFTARSREQFMKQAWKSDNGKYYDSELEAAKADAEYWKTQHRQHIVRDHTDSGYGPSDRGDAVG